MASLNRTSRRAHVHVLYTRPVVGHGRASQPRHSLFSAASWHTRTSHAANRVQVYISRSTDPYLNLSAEHFLLQKSHPRSTLLVLYSNDPCIVIGRNQNPWLEVNLALAARFQALTGTHSNNNTSTTGVALVRRRSGGGTVFHDRGNVNWTVICPSAQFDRDKHAEMVVRALGGLVAVGDKAYVNARHDIVLEQHHSSDPDCSAHGAATSSSKISGSAYKLTRLRALHHGTCLLGSPNLRHIGPLLRSPAAPYIRARGVESVRSRVRNVGASPPRFTDAVRREFVAIYGAADLETTMGAADFAHAEIQAGARELASRDWLYNQTPLFTFSTHPSHDEPRERPALPSAISKDFRATFTARRGQIQLAHLSGIDGVDGSSLHGQYLHNITDWRSILRSDMSEVAGTVGPWLNHLFGINCAR